MKRFFSKIKNLTIKDWIWVALLFLLTIWLIPVIIDRIIRLFNSIIMFFRNIWIYLTFVFAGIDPEGIQSSINYVDNEITVLEAILPINPEYFFIQLGNIFTLPFNSLVFEFYFNQVLNTLLILVRIVLIIFMVGIVIKLLLDNYYSYHEFNEEDIFKESKVKKYTLVIFNFLKKTLFIPIKNFFIFSKETKYWKVAVIIIFFRLKITSLIIETFSFLFAFVVSLDFINLWNQIVAILIDLFPVTKHIPIIVYLIILLIIQCKKWIEEADDEIRHQHLILKTIVKSEMTTTNFFIGPPGSGKDLLGTECTIIAEANLRYDLRTLLFNIRSEFPEFNFVGFEQHLQGLIANRVIVNWRQCEKYVEDYKEIVVSYAGTSAFNYRLNGNKKIYHYNELTNQYILDALADYAHAYFMYIQETVLAASNYSIRFDNVRNDLGHFVEWNDDFLSHDNRHMERFSSYSHINNYDWQRVYKKKVNDEFASLEDGCILALTEYAKERLNQTELKSMKADDEETNQLNDGTNTWWKTKSHENTIRNKRYGQAFINDQRDQSLNADNRETFEYVWTIQSKTDERLVLHGFWYSRMILDFISSWSRKQMERLSDVRSDDPLLFYLIKKLDSWCYTLQQRIINRWGLHQITIENQYKKSVNVPIIHKLAYADRYTSGAYGSMYIKQFELNDIGFNDSPTYITSLATKEELDMQNSYFIERFYFQDTNEEAVSKETNILNSIYFNDSTSGKKIIQEKKITKRAKDKENLGF